MANYKDIDIAFYGSERMDFLDIIPNKYGHLLKWDKRNDVGGYAIHRKEVAKEGWELLVTLDSHIAQYQDSKRLEGMLYDYRIDAVIEGDFMLGSPDNAGGQDFALTQEVGAAEQDMLNRIRTQKGDWRSHQNIGADLEQLEGEPNTRETGQRGEEQIREALTYDGRFMQQDVEVRAVPTSIEQLDFYTTLNSDDDDPVIIRTPQSLDL